MPELSPYGTWTSPVSAADAAAAGRGASWLDRVGDELWWAEARPAEGGRVALVRRTADGGVEDVLPAPWNVRNRVHEYGGRPWQVTGEAVVFTHWADQRVYAHSLATGETTALTPEPAQPQGVRYGDLRPGPDGEVWAVRETSTGPRRTDIERALVAISVTGAERVLVDGHRFFTAPQLSPDGAHAAWLAWDHPAMPWDGTELFVAPVAADGTFGEARVLAGGADVAVCQLEWESPDRLLALLDPDGWWNLHRVGLDGSVVNLAPVASELGGPLWKLGLRWFTPLGGGRHAVLDAGRLAVLDERDGSVTPVEAVAGELTSWSASGLAVVDGGVAGLAAGTRRERAVVSVDLTAGTWAELTPQPADLPAPEYLPVPEERVFTAPDGSAIPAFVFPPANPGFTAPEGERPPFLVHVHGGPTGSSDPSLDLDFAYFTSRGIGVVAVNYGGSTGYGRVFRERLREQWGVVDVGDCVAVAEALVAEGIADGARLAIRGGSAGGFTSAASITMTTTYAAATVKFPILDLATWTGAGGETHDFESQYLHSLVGPYPETLERYRERSPMTHAGSLAGPVLFLQGLEDEICPPEQADRFVAGLAGRGVDYAYLRFEGEQHGFRKAGTIIAALEAELSFYGQVFGFPTPGVAKLELSR
ncbi:prolyl oligopeptidase family serine peptidase [Amycolatopsis saalfeldensis]|uniref:Dipeptidyl aminopeptidase/acylaminoacyl peptidase n=1 Tax=Amycolatopsis saalfeldensis TaxID=394193 RepID=A0A1H8T0J9_9PSEU|nr:prolyl oligopeptidase family serine peptidase [Amycolatopsis saalfeldensis]SEO84461.1 Dipeptidyl aminopeptidase/acylaminoacyl peptidase [Amycolatopsis saalfeldensis]